MPVETECKICNIPTTQMCSNCNQVFYCSLKHQKEDWKTHKPNCHPFKIEENVELGRYLVATRNIKPFEVILKEYPIIRGPSQTTAPVCLGCLNKIDPSNYVDCEKCGWPVCSSACSMSVEHKNECRFFVETGKRVKIREFIDDHPMYVFITALRCILLKKYDDPKYVKLSQLKPLIETRKSNIQRKETVGNLMLSVFNTTLLTMNDIVQAINVINNNAHEMSYTDPSSLGIFYYASFPEHSCIPNIAKSFTNDGKICLWAPRAIKKNTHLSICYTDALWGKAVRQNHLMQSKLFKCSCPRCLDVTEFGSNYDAIKCPEKDCVGVVLPTKLDNWNDNWICTTCKKNVGELYIQNTLDKAGKDLHAMKKTVENYFKYINHYEQWLTRNHYYLCEVKIQLIQLIGKDPKGLMVVPDKELKMKLEYAKELVELYENIGPCETRLLGILCFELHSAIAENTRRLSLQSSISHKNLLEESLMYVEKAVNYLQHESEVYAEGLILKQAKTNRDTLKIVLSM